MNTRTIAMTALAGTLVLAGGCRAKYTAPGAPIYQQEGANAAKVSVNLLGADLRRMVAVEVQQAQRTDDGRIIASMNIRNRQDRPFHLQTRCVFKDANGVGTGDTSAWNDLFLQPMQIQTVSQKSTKAGADLYTFEVRLQEDD